jgi:hypothetical protein
MKVMKDAPRYENFQTPFIKSYNTSPQLPKKMVYDCSGFRPAKWVPKDTNSKEKNCKLGCAGIPVDQLRMRQ